MGHSRLRSVVRSAIKKKILRDGLVKSKIHMSCQLIVFKLIIKFKSLVVENNLFIAYLEENYCKLLDN